MNLTFAKYLTGIVLIATANSVFGMVDNTESKSVLANISTTSICTGYFKLWSNNNIVQNTKLQCASFLDELNLKCKELLSMNNQQGLSFVCDGSSRIYSGISQTKNIEHLRKPGINALVLVLRDGQLLLIKPFFSIKNVLEDGAYWKNSIKRCLRVENWLRMYPDSYKTQSDNFSSSQAFASNNKYQITELAGDHSYSKMSFSYWLPVLFLILTIFSILTKREIQTRHDRVEYKDYFENGNAVEVEIEIENNGRELKQNDVAVGIHDAVKYKSIYDQAINVIKDRRLYLEPDLKQKDIAQYLGTNTKYLYVALRMYGSHSSFNSMINSLRIDRAKDTIRTRVLNDNNYLLSDVFSHCGFSANESFYRVFKKIVGETPKQYANSVLKKAMDTCDHDCQQCASGGVSKTCVLKKYSGISSLVDVSSQKNT